MWSVTVLAMVLSGTALAGPRKGEAPDPRHQQDFTAYTVAKGQWRFGLGPIDYGLLDNLSIGTTSYLWLAGPSARLKVTAIETPRVAVSVEGTFFQVYDFWTSAFTGQDDVMLRTTPLSWTSSFILSPKWSVHVGNTWTRGRVEGTLSGDDIIELVSTVAGGSLDKSLKSYLGNEIYADAWGTFTLAQLNLGAEWRLNRRDSLIVQSNSYLWASGLVVGEVGGAESETEFGAGGAARFRTALTEVPNATSLSWQWSWRRFNLRVGVPLSLRNPLAWTQAVQMYWLLGGQRAAARAPVEG